jgi:hypothetical protein
VLYEALRVVVVSLLELLVASFMRTVLMMMSFV